MFDIRIDDISYLYCRECAGECPIVKAEVHIRDEYTHMVPIKRTWVFDVLSYANKDSGIGAIELIIEDLVKKLWTTLHRPIPKERVVRIDMYLPLHADGIEMSYMNELFTKYLTNERFWDNYYRMLSNSRFGLGIEPDDNHCYMVLPRGSGKWEAQMKKLENYIKTGKVEFVPNRDIKSMFPEKLLLEHVERQIKFGDPWIKPLTKQEIDDMMNRETVKNFVKERNALQISDVIFNDPATIVFWRDGSKTVVKAQDEPYDPEKGLAMAIAKKVYGNKYDYYNTIKHWLKKYEPKVKVVSMEGLLEYLEPKEEKNE